jgi:hypothetical protein
VQAASGQASTNTPATVPTDTARQNRLDHALQAFLTEYNNGEASAGGAPRANGQILSQLLPPGARPWAAPRITQPRSSELAPLAHRKPPPSRSAAQPAAVAATPPGSAPAPARPVPVQARQETVQARQETVPARQDTAPPQGPNTVAPTVAPRRFDPPALRRFDPQAPAPRTCAPARPLLDLTPGALRYQPPENRRAGAPRPAPTPSPGLAPASALEPASSRHLSSRAAVAAAGGLGVAIALVAALAWGAGTNSTLSQRTHQLASAKADITALQRQLAGVEHRAYAQSGTLQQVQQQYRAAKARLALAEGELRGTNGHLGVVLNKMDQAEKQLGTTKSQLAQVKGRLGQAQRNLSASERQTSQCREAAALGQQDTQVLSSFIQVENVFLVGAQAKDATKVQTEVSQMQSLSEESQAIGPRFVAALNRCMAP